MQGKKGKYELEKERGIRMYEENDFESIQDLNPSRKCIEDADYIEESVRNFFHTYIKQYKKVLQQNFKRTATGYRLDLSYAFSEKLRKKEYDLYEIFHTCICPLEKENKKHKKIEKSEQLNDIVIQHQLCEKCWGRVSYIIDIAIQDKEEAYERAVEQFAKYVQEKTYKENELIFSTYMENETYREVILQCFEKDILNFTYVGGKLNVNNSTCIHIDDLASVANKTAKEIVSHMCGGSYKLRIEDTLEHMVTETAHRCKKCGFQGYYEAYGMTEETFEKYLLEIGDLLSKRAIQE